MLRMGSRKVRFRVGAGLMAFAKGIAAGTLRWARGQEGRFDAPLSSSGLHLPLTKKGLLAPFKPQSRRAPYKKASRFAQRFFVFRRFIGPSVAARQLPAGERVQQMPFLTATPPVKKSFRKIRRFWENSNIKIIFPLLLQRRRLRPAAETGRSCWGRGQQDARPAQGP